ncbi:hypothetical protein [Olivibacter sitiensis]|uniref:hypothetical protein n=1 Tax=Olivibacter sitiensis TaxID=376470 RepID=UPI0004161AA1|nr:hypothetical protein [Olivibacter sitiensis]
MKFAYSIGIAVIAALFCSSLVWGQEKQESDSLKSEPIPMPHILSKKLAMSTDYKMKWKQVDGRVCVPMPNAVKLDAEPMERMRFFPADSLRQDSLLKKRK